MQISCLRRDSMRLVLVCSSLFFVACGGSSGPDGSTADSDLGSSDGGDLPTVSITDASILEGDSGTANLQFVVSLSEQANGNVNVSYATADGSATAGEDYSAVSDTITISSGTTSAAISVSVTGDTNNELVEFMTMTLSDVSSNAVLGETEGTGEIIDDDYQALNDTGVVTCASIDRDGLDCAASGVTESSDGVDDLGNSVPKLQDATHGRDATANDNTDGWAGFSFTKLDAQGAELTDQSVDYASTPWSCLRDNVTNMVWEVKTDDGGLRDKDWTYTWYTADPSLNGGSSGAANGGVCVDAGNCDTEKYVAAVNAIALCGYDDWRLPVREELRSIISYRNVRGIDSIDEERFANSGGSIWTSSPSITDDYGDFSIDHAWTFSEDWGYEGRSNKGNARAIRLVREGS